MLKKKLWFIISIIVVLFGGGGPLLGEAIGNQNSQSLYKDKIIIGMETWPGYLPLIVAQDQGYFKQAGLNVEVKRYVALGELSKDYIAGKMQGRANLTLDTVNEYLKGLDHRVILAIDYSNGSDAIIARKGIDTVRDFKDKKVGFEQNTLEDFFITWALTESDLKISDVVPVYGGPEDTPKLLQEGKVDVAVSHEPFISKLISSGNFHVVYSSAQTPGLITDVLTFRTDFIKAYPDTVQTIVDVYFQALKFWKEHPKEAYAIVSKEFNDTPEGIAQQMKGITMLDERDNQTAFTFAAGFQSLYGNMRQIGSFVKQHQGVSDQNIDTDKLIDRRFIQGKNE